MPNSVGLSMFSPQINSLLTEWEGPLNEMGDTLQQYGDESKMLLFKILYEFVGKEIPIVH